MRDTNGELSIRYDSATREVVETKTFDDEHYGSREVRVPFDDYAEEVCGMGSTVWETLVGSMTLDDRLAEGLDEDGWVEMEEVVEAYKELKKKYDTLLARVGEGENL